jgi:cell wall assembly regulator SMI1
LSIEDAIVNYKEFVGDARWEPGWLPVFANGGGDFYFVDLSVMGSTMVRHFRIEQSEHPVEFLDIESMMATLAAGFERGVFFVDGSGYLEMDDRAFASMAREFNPDVPWWAD